MKNMKSEIKNYKGIISFTSWLVCLIFSLFSCASMQEDTYIGNVSGNSEISNFERRFSEIDARFFDSDSEKDIVLQKNAENLISDIETALKDSSLKKAFAARLYALAGLTAYDLGNRGQAKKYYGYSVESFKGDSRALVLASRLGIEKNLSEKVPSLTDKSLALLELALNHYSKQEYAAAVANFDEAFLSLEPFYRNIYKDLRDTSWNLRNLPKDQNSWVSGLLTQKNLTVMQMLLIANQNPELLFNYTAGKEISDKVLFNKISGSGLLNPASKPLDAENTVSKNTTVTRQIAARFLWNLYNQRRNTPNNTTKYSEAYKNKKRSPITDVKLSSPDFDAVLGCVENEIMHLEDGIEFGAEKEVSGMEFDESVKRIR